MGNRIPCTHRSKADYQEEREENDDAIVAIYKHEGELIQILSLDML